MQRDCSVFLAFDFLLFLHAHHQRFEPKRVTNRSLQDMRFSQTPMARNQTIDEIISFSVLHESSAHLGVPIVEETVEVTGENRQERSHCLLLHDQLDEQRIVVFIRINNHLEIAGAEKNFNQRSGIVKGQQLFLLFFIGVELKGQIHVGNGDVIVDWSEVHLVDSKETTVVVAKLETSSTNDPRAFGEKNLFDLLPGTLRLESEEIDEKVRGQGFLQLFITDQSSE